MCHVPEAVGQLQTSALHPSLCKLLVEIRSKVVPSLSWSEFVTKMAYGVGETDMRIIYCREPFTEISNLLEQNKEMFVRSASADLKIPCCWVRTMQRHTMY